MQKLGFGESIPVINSFTEAGMHKIAIDCRELKQGLYLVIVSVEQQIFIKKLLVL